MLQRIDLRGMSGELSDHLPRPVVPSDGPVDAVREILTAVRERGDAAIREFTVRFDGVRVVDPRVPVTDLVAALDRVSPDVRAALEAAAASIEAYHRAQLPSDVRVERPGVSIVGMHRAVERVIWEMMMIPVLNHKRRLQRCNVLDYQKWRKQR